VRGTGNTASPTVAVSKREPQGASLSPSQSHAAYLLDLGGSVRGTRGAASVELILTGESVTESAYVRTYAVKTGQRVELSAHGSQPTVGQTDGPPTTPALLRQLA